MSSFADIDELDISSWLDWMGVDYRRTTGSRGVQLNLKTCPFCGNNNWKVYLNEDTGLGNCFHGDCESKFNKYKLIKAVLETERARDVFDNVDEYLEANDWLPKERVEKPVSPFTATVNLTGLVPLPVNGRNLLYLERRNISVTSTEHFELGFCKSGGYSYKLPDGRDALVDFSMRVIIPIRELDGSVVTFQGRDITGEANKKYMFPAGLKSTGSVLYHGNHALGAESIVLCEGVFDVISVWQAFQDDPTMRNIVPVGTFGKHLSTGGGDSQLSKLLLLKEQGLKTITFMWDGEATAIKDACAAALELSKYGFITRIARLEGKDPNEMHPEQVRQAYWNAMFVNKSNIIKLLMGLIK